MRLTRPVSAHGTALALVVVLTTAACGTRTENRSLGPGAAISAPVPDQGPVPTVGGSAPADPGAVTPATGAQAARAASGSAPPPAGGGATKATAPSAGAGAPGNTSAGPRPAPSTTAPPVQTDRAAPAFPVSPSSPKTAVRLASVGVLSGIAGQVFVPMVQGAQVWVKSVNASGGLNGHPVELTLYDDGGDTARHRAQVQDAIERRNVIAFLANAEVFSGRGSVDYITSKRVPVIGSETASPWFYESPMYFPQASSGDGLVFGGLYLLADTFAPQGKTKLGTLVCVEAQQCADIDRIAGTSAAAIGFKYVYRAKASLGTPDFTAECLAARNAGVEIFLVGMDPNSIQRVAASCARQGFKPVYGTVSHGVTDRFKTDTNLDGMVASTNVFPYFQTGTAATDEFQRVMRTIGANLPTSVSSATGWVAGKLLERASRALPEPPTSAALLEGLWSLEGDDLGGLTQPLTFERDKPPPLVVCWWGTTIAEKAWTSPDKFVRHCRTPEK
jgi:branched-chain amino acid transport system substrate-binding protein